MKSPRLWILLALAATIGVLLFILPIQAWTQVFLGWVEQAGVWGPVLLSLAYVPATVLLIPGTLLTLGAGFAYELLLGTAIVSIGSILGSSATFLLGRTLMRDWVGRQIEKRPRLKAIDAAAAKDGFRLTLLIRLSPAFPYSLMGYVFGVTRVSFRDHFFASWIGMLPGTVLYVYLGCAARKLADPDMGAQGPHPAFFIAGLVLTIGVTIYITIFARRAISAAVPDSLPPETAAAAEN